MNNKKFPQNLHFLFYAVGAVLGLAVTFFATWADLEASYYGFDRTGGARLGSLSCPFFMTETETTTISVQLRNSTDKKVSPSIKVDLSSPISQNSTIEKAELAPGESKYLAWEIGPENIDLNRFVFARIWTYAAYPLKDQEATCGVFVLPLPGNGAAYTWGMVILSLLGMGYGLFIRRDLRTPGRNPDYERFSFLAIVITLGLVVSYLGLWLAGVLVLVLAFLVIVISLSYSFRTP